MMGKKKNYKKVNWKTITEDIAQRLKQEREDHKARCLKRPSPTKHKYIYILGRTKKQTKELKKTLDNLNPGVLVLEYPKERGEQKWILINIIYKMLVKNMLS